MLNNRTSPARQAARRRVQAGLWMFFGGAVALLAGLLAHLHGPSQGPAPADSLPALPMWLVPESAAGYTAALLLVCWGVWALGSGLRLAREGA